MTLQFPSDRLIYQDFVQTYENLISGYLDGQEAERRRAVNRFFAILAAGVGVGGIMLLLRPFGDDSFAAAFFAGFAGFGVAGWQLGRAENDITHGLLSRICGGLGLSYERNIGRPDYFADFKKTKLIGGFNEETWEDAVAGSHSGARFECCEAHLIQESGSGKNRSRRTVFHGQLIVIDYPKPFLGVTVLHRDRGVFNRFTKPGSEYSHVGLASGEFEKAFEAWSTDQVEARDLLDPIVLERFQELERLYGGDSLRAAFIGGRLILAIATGDRLSLGSMFKSINGVRQVETILKEFDLIFDLIDVLIKRVDRPMDGPITAAGLRAADARSADD